MYYICTFLIGAIIAVMVVFNTNLGILTTNEVSIAINQVVGIVSITIVMAFGHRSSQINPKREKSAWWQWFGGIFGLGVITINYYSVSNAGTTIAMAAAVLGQCIMGTIFDITGWLGMKRIPLSKRKIVSLLLSLIGILVMLFSNSEKTSMSTTLFGLFGIVAGFLTMIQMVYNSGFAKKKGAYFSARQNVISGLFGIVLFMLIAKPGISLDAIKAIPGIPFATLLGGGLLACVVVIGTNIIIPRIPGAASAILLSAGQILSAVLLDYIASGIFEPPLLIGSLIMIAGIAIGG